VVVLTGRKRSCSLYSPTSWSVIGAGSGASGVVSGGTLEPSLMGAMFGVYSDDITTLTKPWDYPVPSHTIANRDRTLPRPLLSLS